MSPLREAAQQALEAHANRYQVVRDGYWWRVKIGDGTQTVGQHHTETGALRLASELHRAFHDGGFVVQEALKAALEQPEPGGVCVRCGGWVCDPVLKLEQTEQPEQGPHWLTKELMADYLDMVAEAISENSSEMLRHKAHWMRTRGEV